MGYIMKLAKKGKQNDGTKAFAYLVFVGGWERGGERG